MRLAPAILVLAIAASSCIDDTVELRRGAPGPARYAVEVRATAGDQVEERAATLQIVPTDDGVTFTLLSGDQRRIDAELVRADDGSLDLARIRGAAGGRTDEADLAALIDQIDPPLPAQRVRIGDGWSSTRHIETASITAIVTSELRLIRFHRLDGRDTVELAGDVTGELRTGAPADPIDGPLTGQTTIWWSLHEGRVVASDTTVVWEIGPGGPVTLTTSVSPA